MNSLTMLQFFSALFPCFSRSKTNDVGPHDDEVTSSLNQIPVVRQISQEIDIPPAPRQNEFWWTDNPANRASIVLEVAKMADHARKNKSRRQDTGVPVSRFDTVSIKSDETCSSFDAPAEGYDEMKNQEIMENVQSIAGKSWKTFIYFNNATKEVELDIEGCAKV